MCCFNKSKWGQPLLYCSGDVDRYVRWLKTTLDSSTIETIDFETDNALFEKSHKTDGLPLSESHFLQFLLNMP